MKLKPIHFQNPIIRRIYLQLPLHQILPPLTMQPKRHIPRKLRILKPNCLVPFGPIPPQRADIHYPLSMGHDYVHFLGGW